MNILRCLSAVRLRFWLLAATGWVVLALVMMLPPEAPLRVIAVFLFILSGPGYPLSALVSRGAAESWVLTIALSAALAIIVTVVMTVIRNESIALRIGILAAITTVAAIMWGIRDLRTGSAVEKLEDAAGTP